MKKSVAFIGTLLMLLSVSSCKNNGNNQKEKQYPEVEPILRFNWIDSHYFVSPLDVDHVKEYESLIVGNCYVGGFFLDNKGQSYVFQEDFSFTYNKDVYDINPYIKLDEGTTYPWFIFVVEVKARSEDNDITISYLDKTVQVIDIPIIEPNTTLNYYRFDNTCETSRNIESLEPLVGKATLVTTKEQYDSYPALASSFVRSSINDAFFETNSIIYVVVRGAPSEHKYEGYFIEDSALTFRVVNYRPEKEEPILAIYDPTCTAYTLVIGKADGDAFEHFDIWINSRFKQ